MYGGCGSRCRHDLARFGVIDEVIASGRVGSVEEGVAFQVPSELRPNALLQLERFPSERLGPSYLPLVTEDERVSQEKAPQPGWLVRILDVEDGKGAFSRHARPFQVPKFLKSKSETHL